MRSDLKALKADARESEDSGRDAEPYTYLPFQEGSIQRSDQ